MSPAVNHRSESGFTLLETIFTLFIIGLVTLLAIPTLTNSATRIGGDLLLNQLITELKVAQQEAISYGTDISVSFGGNKLIISTKNKVLRQFNLPQRYMIITTFPHQLLLFANSGQAVGGTIKLLYDKRVCGEIRVQVASGVTKVVAQHD